MFHLKLTQPAACKPNIICSCFVDTWESNWGLEATSDLQRLHSLSCGHTIWGEMHFKLHPLLGCTVPDWLLWFNSHFHQLAPTSGVEWNQAGAGGSIHWSQNQERSLEMCSVPGQMRSGGGGERNQRQTRKSVPLPAEPRAERDERKEAHWVPGMFYKNNNKKIHLFVPTCGFNASLGIKTKPSSQFVFFF